MIDAIRELTALGVDDLCAHADVTYDAEGVLRRLVTRALERGVELQRTAILLAEEEARSLPPPPRLPSEGITPLVPPRDDR
jgi:hypothetical protein